MNEQKLASELVKLAKEIESGSKESARGQLGREWQQGMKNLNAAISDFTSVFNYISYMTKGGGARDSLTKEFHMNDKDRQLALKLLKQIGDGIDSLNDAYDELEPVDSRLINELF